MIIAGIEVVMPERRSLTEVSAACVGIIDLLDPEEPP
jgi:hypothetical protein